MRISVVIPAYNEEENLKELLPKVWTQVGQEAEVIVVDDASTDNTARIAREHGALLIQNPYNMGNGASVKRGIREASYDNIILMDADGQHLPEEIPKLIKEFEGVDMVIGQRGKDAQRWWRRFANSIYNALASYVSGVPILDLTSGFRMLKKSKAVNFLHMFPNTFSYPSTITLAFVKAAYPIKFVPVKVLPRKKGKSKINLLTDGGRFFVIIMRISVFFSPLKIFLPVSLIFFLTGVLYYLYTFITQHRFTNMSVLLISTSVVIFMLGLVSEQIASLRMERKDG